MYVGATFSRNTILILIVGKNEGGILIVHKINNYYGIIFGVAE